METFAFEGEFFHMTLCSCGEFGPVRACLDVETEPWFELYTACGTLGIDDPDAAFSALKGPFAKLAPAGWKEGGPGVLTILPSESITEMAARAGTRKAARAKAWMLVDVHLSLLERAPAAKALHFAGLDAKEKAEQIQCMAEFLDMIASGGVASPEDAGKARILALRVMAGERAAMAVAARWAWRFQAEHLPEHPEARAAAEDMERDMAEALERYRSRRPGKPEPPDPDSVH
ncbi:MAG: hypothetical protein LBW85_13505 [Deltaproteobacteria bacterium]|jgi:hypothetical protein|nr:hypothetical protein [Deltaproteobacteria bacterium]